MRIIKKLNHRLGALMASLLLLATPFGVTTIAHAADAGIQSGLCSGIELDPTGDTNCKSSGETTKSVSDTIASVINILSILVGVIAVVMVIFGGFKYITSGGDSGKVTSAKNTIVYAMIGLIVAALAQVLVRFVLARATGASDSGGGSGGSGGVGSNQFAQ